MCTLLYVYNTYASHACVWQCLCVKSRLHRILNLVLEWENSLFCAHINCKYWLIQSMNFTLKMLGSNLARSFHRWAQDEILHRTNFHYFVQLNFIQNHNKIELLICLVKRHTYTCICLTLSISWSCLFSFFVVVVVVRVFVCVNVWLHSINRSKH